MHLTRVFASTLPTTEPTESSERSEETKAKAELAASRFGPAVQVTLSELAEAKFEAQSSAVFEETVSVGKSVGERFAESHSIGFAPAALAYKASSLL